MTDRLNLHPQLIREKLGSNLADGDFEIDVVQLPHLPPAKDRFARLRTLEEILEHFEHSDSEGDSLSGYLIQVKPKKKAQQGSDPLATATAAAQDRPEVIYQGDGKLNSPFLLKNAELLFASRDYALSRNIFKALLQSGTRPATALFGIGRCFEAEGKLDEAKLRYEESIAYHPDPEVYQRLAAVLIRQEKEQYAAEVIERALALKNISSPVRVELCKAAGNCYTRLNRPLEAERYFQRAIEIDPEADELHANLGALQLKTGKLSEAKKHFEKAVALNPRNERALSGLGSCHLADDEKRLAHDCFARALDIQLNNPTAIYHLVKCAYEIKSYATAARLLEEYVQIAPFNANLLYSLAGLQFHLARHNDARATVKKITEIAPEHHGAKELLAMIERTSGN